MSETYGFFNNDGGDRVYLDDQFTAPFGAIVGNAGVVSSIDNEFKPTYGGMDVNIASGFAFGGILPGWWYRSTETITKTINTTSAGQKRIDLVVLRFDRNNSARKASCEVIEGTQVADNPVAPGLTQNEMLYEVCIAELLVEEGVITKLTDKREYINQNGGSVDNTDIPKGKIAMFDVGTSSYIASENGYLLSTGTRLAASGSVVLLPDFNLEQGYNYYIQSDGSISTAVAQRLAGHAIGGDLFLVIIDDKGGIAKEYTENVVEFFATPSTSGKVRLKISNAGTSDGTKIMRKTSAWTSGDTKNTGTHVVTITDDSTYSGNNEWYEDTGLANGTTYYYKAFPYKGTTYNEMIGVNECYSRAGLMLHEYTCDNISGNIIVDTAGSNNATSSNITFNSGKVGNSAQGYGSGVGVLNSSINMSQKAVSFWVYHSGSGSCACLGCTSNQSPQIYIIGNTLYVGAWNPIFSELFYGKKASLTAGWNHIVVNFGTSSVYVYVNTVGVGSGNLTLSTSNINRLYYSFRSSGHNCDAKYYLKGKVDQLRFYSIALNGSEINKLYNGGAGC